MTTESKVPAIIRNEFFYAFARLCMIVVATIGVPIAGFILARVVATGDEIHAQLQAQNVSLLLLSSEVKFRFTAIDDHEHRIRRIEMGSAR